jgi:hypothetical protein
MMDKALKRVWLLNQYRFLSGVISDRNELFEPLSDEELSQLSDHDLNKVVREMQRLANTPPPR